MRRGHSIFIGLFLTVATLVVFWQVHNHEFINYDDNLYITENDQVQKGLSRESVVWAFTTTHASNWHPLTWLSHMVDFQLYGLNPKGHHLTNVFFHLLNTLLLFYVLQRMTGALWRSGFVAALFALHPLHVESVAWVAERKDVLSTLFWLLTIWAYTWYVERPRRTRYLLTLLTFTLGLMAKPMLVTLPFVLLLLDYWPLGRFQVDQLDTALGAPTQASLSTRSVSSQTLRLIWEKAPFFALAAASSVVTFLVQKGGGAVRPLERFPITIRIANGLVSYVKYMGKMIWPSDLAVFYPHPGASLPIWQAVAAGLLLLSISIAVIRLAKNHPYLAVGWLWYLGTLVPLIGFVQVGEQALADRYTYVPLIGLFIIIAWGVSDIAAKWRYQRVVFIIAAGAPLLALMICTWRQLHHWNNSRTLWEYAVNLSPNDYYAYNKLGAALREQGKRDEAIAHFSQALRIKPDYVIAHNNLGALLIRQGKFDEAIGPLSQALKIKPDYEKAHNNLAVALYEQGKLNEAIAHYSQALRIKPDYAIAHNNMGDALARQGKLDKAISHFSEAVKINPDYADAHNSPLLGDLATQAALYGHTQ
jgi:tetratricopeptide (TPR) repeat protein